MEPKTIKSKTQYKDYCDKLEELTDIAAKTAPIKNEIKLLTFLIEKYDQKHNTFEDIVPIQ
jgi:HTH-type transcriptional regulator/antitoxin HigA